MNIFSKLIYKSLITETLSYNLMPEKGSEDYSLLIEKLINELLNFKKSLKKGADRHKHRKEISNLQRAIESLRYINRKNLKFLDS